MIYHYVGFTIGIVLTFNLQYPRKLGHTGTRGAGSEFLDQSRLGIL